MSRKSPFCKVDQLMDKLSKDYPGLNKTFTASFSHRSSPVSRNIDTPVRPTIPSDFALTMLREDAKFSKVKDLKLPNPPKKPRPITVKVHEWEAETSLNCFMKHIANGSYERYVSEKVPAFRKGREMTVRLPEGTGRRKKRRMRQIVCLSPNNLELLGQKEFSNTQPSLTRKNLNSVKRRLQRNVKNWCLAEIRNKNVELQLIDHHTFRSKH